MKLIETKSRNSVRASVSKHCLNIYRLQGVYIYNLVRSSSLVNEQCYFFVSQLNMDHKQYTAGGILCKMDDMKITCGSQSIQHVVYHK